MVSSVTLSACTSKDVGYGRVYHYSHLNLRLKKLIVLQKFYG